MCACVHYEAILLEVGRSRRSSDAPVQNTYSIVETRLPAEDLLLRDADGAAVHGHISDADVKAGRVPAHWLVSRSVVARAREPHRARRVHVRGQRRHGR